MGGEDAVTLGKGVQWDRVWSQGGMLCWVL
jgi:hypothetical protein